MALGKGRGRDADAICERIAKVQAEVAADREAAAEERRFIASRDQLAAEVAELEARGEISREEVDRRLDEADREANARARKATARERAADVRERELAELEAELSGVLFDNQLDAVRIAAKRTAAADSAIPELIDGLAAALRKVQEAAEAEDAARAELRQLRPDGDERDVDYIDAPDWPDGLDELIATLKEGPPQPNVRAARQLAEHRRRMQASETSTINSFLSQFGASQGPTAEAALRRFSPDMQERIRAARERALRETARRRAEIAGGGFVNVDQLEDEPVSL